MSILGTFARCVWIGHERHRKNSEPFVMLKGQTVINVIARCIICKLNPVLPKREEISRNSRCGRMCVYLVKWPRKISISKRAKTTGTLLVDKPAQLLINISIRSRRLLSQCAFIDTSQLPIARAFASVQMVRLNRQYTLMKLNCSMIGT